MKKIITVLFVAALFFPGNALAKKIVLVFEEYPPYEFMENGQLAGTDVDIIREIFKRLGLETDFQERPWKRALTEVEKGDADAIFSLVKTEEREKFLYYPSEDLSYEKFIFIARKGSGMKVKSLDDLKGKRVGVCTDYSYDPVFDNYKGFEKEYSKNDEQQLSKLGGDRMDVAIMNELVFKFTVKKMGDADRFEILDYEIAPKHLMYAGFSKALGEQSKSLAENFSRILQQLKQEGFYQKILDKYR